MATHSHVPSDAVKQRPTRCFTDVLGVLAGLPCPRNITMVVDHQWSHRSIPDPARSSRHSCRNLRRIAAKSPASQTQAHDLTASQPRATSCRYGWSLPHASHPHAPRCGRGDGPCRRLPNPSSDRTPGIQLFWFRNIRTRDILPVACLHQGKHIVTDDLQQLLV